MSAIQAQAVFETINTGINAANGALDLYNSVLDQVIPWQTFEGTITELRKYEKDYSTKSAEIVGKVKTLLLNSQDEYLQATQSVFEWCGLTSQLLSAYLSLFQSFDAEKAGSQKVILVKVLADGVVKMNEAQEALGKSSKSFNEASGQLSVLTTQLSQDFAEGSSYYNNQVDKLRKEAYGGAAAGVIGGVFGLIVSYSIAAGVLEGELIPALKRKFQEVQNSFEKLKDIVSQANNDIDDTKIKLQTEIKAIGKLKTQTEATSTFLGMDPSMIGLLEKSVNKLIDLCEEYMKRHS